MDCVQDTPVKRRKVEVDQEVRSAAYDSQNGSGDDLSEEYDTLATTPLPGRQRHNASHEPTSSPASFVTQPTQILNRGPSQPEQGTSKSSILQIAASSPVRAGSSIPQRNGQGPAAPLASMMAPPGTSFRAPPGITNLPPKSTFVDLSDDEGPVYRGNSPEEESQRSLSANIKPSTFIQKVQKQITSRNLDPVSRDRDPRTQGASRFKEITSNSFYKPTESVESVNCNLPKPTLSGSVYDQRNRDENKTTSKILAQGKRSGDLMANAYGGKVRAPRLPQQSAPSKALLIDDMSLEGISDYQLREKTSRMLNICPKYSVRSCYDALLEKKGHQDDAMDWLIKQEDQLTTSQIVMTISDDETSHGKVSVKSNHHAKQQLKVPGRSIQEKWTATQGLKKSSPSPPASPVASKTQRPARRRLVQGRKHRFSSVTESPTAPTRILTSSPKTHGLNSENNVDSGLGTDQEDHTLDGRVLEFFNSCTAPDLGDMASITDELALLVTSRRPFRNLDQVRQISIDAVATKGKRKTTRKPIGDKIVDKCTEMLSGYEAVDALVRRCETLGRTVANEMKNWGIDIFGSKDHELDLVTFEGIETESQAPLRDSGIGTPTSAVTSADEDDQVNGPGTRPKHVKRSFFPQPSILGEGVQLKDYQIVGFNWLTMLFEKQLSCILADDMGLGKTCQVIAFLAHLLEKGIQGPHLVVVPGSTLENWLREFKTFCPKLNVFPYYAGQNERFDLRDQIESSLSSINVIITTYTLARQKEDNKFMRRIKPVACIYDEGHLLKNRKSIGYEALMRIPAKFRLLLTGTPLQNNLQELASLLGFILPSIFNEHTEELEYIFNHKARTTNDTHAALLSAQRITRARSMMTPFVLRRKKYQVLKHLPTKSRRVVFCEMSASQANIYTGQQERARQIVMRRAAGEKTGNETTNIMMQLRQASIHPLLFRRRYDDIKLAKMSKACLKEEEFCESNVDLVFEDMAVMTDFELHQFCIRYPKTMTKFALQDEPWMDSGKVTKLCELLVASKAQGDRVLIFSQFVMVMTILESVMETLGMKYFRLDGSTKIDERQDMIDQFHEENEITVFLLSTKAGGAGINLACANKVIIFDSSFNPQDDIQAENRAHRVGQTREVEVIRLVVKDTIEEQIYALGETKLALDDRVAGEVVAEEDDKNLEKLGAKKVEDIMIKQIESGVDHRCEA